MISISWYKINGWIISSCYFYCFNFKIDQTKNYESVSHEKRISEIGSDIRDLRFATHLAIHFHIIARWYNILNHILWTQIITLDKRYKQEKKNIHTGKKKFLFLRVLFTVPTRNLITN